jgi:hypothetical protein
MSVWLVLLIIFSSLCFLFFIIPRIIGGNSTYRAPTSVPIKLEISDDFKCRHDSIGNMIITGSVKNLSNKDLRFVELRGTALNSSGEIINTDTSYTDSDILYSGASSTFTIYVDDPSNQGTNCKVKVEDYSIN